jgi:hypothetical protein
MQDYREIDRIRKDFVAVRSLAKRLLDLPHADWNDTYLGICNTGTDHAALNRIVIIARPRFRLLAGKDGDVTSAIAAENAAGGNSQRDNFLVNWPGRRLQRSAQPSVTAPADCINVEVERLED